MTKIESETKIMSELNSKVDELLTRYSALKLHNKELLAENHQLHATLTSMHMKQVSAGNKVANLVEQLKTMQEL